MELPDFHIDHAEKIEWMIETKGYAVEPVAPNPETDPPSPAYTYTIGVPAAVGYAEIAVFGLTPVASSGLLDLVVDACRGGTEIPLGVELVGLLDNDLRCLFAPIDLEQWREMFSTAIAWYRGEPFDMVQMLYPDRNGFMPYEPGFDHRLRFAQPVIATLGTVD
jgi:hypothetical protein